MCVYNNDVFSPINHHEHLVRVALALEMAECWYIPPMLLNTRGPYQALSQQITQDSGTDCGYIYHTVVICMVILLVV